MSRFRSSNDDLAYGDIPQRWDRERFERFSRGGPPARFEDDYRFVERDSPGRRDIAVAERRESSRPGHRFEERDRFWEEDRVRSRPRRRTDRELFGELDPREVAEMALVPARRKSITREDWEYDQRGPPRPGLLRRQSSLDTFDRRPSRVEKEEYRIPPYTPVPLPIRRRRDDWDETHYYRDYEPEDYREVEIQRERSVHRRRGPKSEKAVSKAPSSSSSSSSSAVEEIKSVKASTKAPSTRAPSTKAKSTRAPSVHESFHELSIHEDIEPPGAPTIHESIHETAFEESVREERRFKKGKTRMPKRLVRREAIMDLGYPFDEEDDFFVLRIALEKEQIDEVIQISETYKDGEKKKVYRFEEKIDEVEPIPAPPVGEHEEIERTEWINPPTVVGARSHRSKSVREASPSVRSSVSRRHSPSRARSRAPSGTFVEERKTVIEETRSPPPPPSAFRAPSAPPPPGPPEFYEEKKTVIEERLPSHHPGTVVLAEREHRSDRDINHEIRALEAERRALRLEREAEERRDMALRLRERPDEEFQLVEYRDRPRDELVIYERERERSPPRNVIRVEKDRKGRMALVRSAH
ncbi:hypothetical protein PRZ48_009912 [Zasmidium cellare]|uniref:DUF8035 domain-containing protein n=1 Tax=Zasmidium cellare TaxID=395010 RepID=A0ABR0EDX9_ZASCE|nr:hypothetical protein PRZ48_009912 [Zasmidium cellare]